LSEAMTVNSTASDYSSDEGYLDSGRS